MNDFEIVRWPTGASVGMNDDAPPGPTERPTFEAVYRDGADHVYRTLRGLGVPKQDCEDAMHEVFLIVRRRLPEYEPRGKLKAWLGAIARKVALQDTPLSEIALTLGIPEGTVGTRLRLAREDLAAAWKRLEARDRGKSKRFAMFTPAVLLEAARRMPGAPADMKDRVFARLQSAPAPSPPPPGLAQRMVKQGAGAALSGAGRAIRGGLLVALGIVIGALWSPIQRSHPEPLPVPFAVMAPAPQEVASAAPIATPSASAADLPAASSGAVADTQEDEAMERFLMSEAADALHANNAALALAAVEEHAQRFHGGGRLAETREAYRIQALRMAGRAAEADERLARFTRIYPGSPRLPGLRAAAEGDAGPR
jgi:hypothetical protein